MPSCIFVASVITAESVSQDLEAASLGMADARDPAAAKANGPDDKDGLNGENEDADKDINDCAVNSCNEAKKKEYLSWAKFVSEFKGVVERLI